jgi:hypothetical protein
VGLTTVVEIHIASPLLPALANGFPGGTGLEDPSLHSVQKSLVCLPFYSGDYTASFDANNSPGCEHLEIL